TTEKHKLIPTILSRCQIYDFNRIRIEETVGYLKSIAAKEGVVYDDESLHLIARKADGGMRDALSMFDKAVSFCEGKLAFKEVAATLNVLDYDTYFGITENILAGDYKSALLLFDEVLKKGFSGQTFMSGLASHFRDLLMCKDPQTLPLLEITGSVLERYKGQSAACGIDLLFGGISLLSALDGGFRTATNQRLHVELGLMKLCGLGQKKNSDGELATPPTLPQLNRQEAQAAAPKVVAQPAGQPASQQVGQPAVQQVANTAPQQTVATPAPQPTVAAPQPAVAPAQRTPHTAPARPTTHSSATKPLFGGSINAVLMGQKPGADSEEGEDKNEIFDPQCEAKINAKRGEFLSALNLQKPRLANALGSMVVSDHTIRATVMTEMVREELLRNSKELNTLLREVCGIEGSVVFDIEVAKSNAVLKPVKAEEKLRFLVERNGEVTNLIQSLDLDLV
ncbi:MAG: DNA polymerase III subunit gamma/tau, partial [Tidjanibacter sp.]|nr:DNA polymerase III subunit gamma/tau [Tidjanibacter sp.]